MEMRMRMETGMGWDGDGDGDGMGTNMWMGTGMEMSMEMCTGMRMLSRRLQWAPGWRDGMGGDISLHPRCPYRGEPSQGTEPLLPSGSRLPESLVPPDQLLHLVHAAAQLLALE